jgi:hypothetical protein
MVMAGILLVALLIPLLAVVLDSAPVRALATRLERRGGEVATPHDGARLAALEGEVQRLADQVASLEEEGRFLRQLLERRRPEPGLPPAEGSRDDRGSA